MKIRRKVQMVPYIAKRIGRKISHHKVFFSLLGFNALMYIVNAAFGPYITAYYRNQGMSVAQIGILTAIGPMIVLFAQPAWGVIGDKTGKYMMALRMSILGSMLAVLAYYAPPSFATFAFAAGLYALCNCGIQPLGDTVVVQEIAKRGYRFSFVRMGGTVGYALMVILAGRLLQKHPSASFAITSFFFFCLFLVTLTMPKNSNATGKKRNLDISRLFRNGGIMYIILFVLVFQVALGFYNSFLGVYVTEMGYGTATLGMLSCISALSELPVLLCIDWALRRFRTEVLLIFAGLMQVLRLLLPPLTSSLAGIIAAQSLQGLTYMIMYYSAVMYINNNLEVDLRGTGMAVLCVVQTGIASLFSNIVGGQLGQLLGLNTAYILYASMLFLFITGCTVRLLIRSRRDKPMQEEPAAHF